MERYSKEAMIYKKLAIRTLKENELHY